MLPEPRIPLFLDCDPGIDDAVALGYLLCKTGVEVTGVGASAGNVTTAQATANAQSWLELAGRADIPVHPGVELPVAWPPLSAAPPYAEDTHGPAGTGYAHLPQPTTTPHPDSAATAWVRAARAHPGELIGVVTGPCTNVALALQAEPQLPQLLKRLFIMAGAFNYRGNTKPTTEWNTDFDPEATRQVLAGFGQARNLPVIAPLEATEAIVMTPDRLDRIRAAACGAPWGVWVEHLAEALRFYFDFHQLDGLGYLAHLHDPYVLAAALSWARRNHNHAPVPWAHTAQVAVDVELTGELTRGQTVADWLGRWGREPNAELICSLEAAGFLDHLEATLIRGPASTGFAQRAGS